jgi:hypothetical protein
MLVSLVLATRFECVGDMVGGAMAGFVLFLSLKREGVHASRVEIYKRRHRHRDSISDFAKFSFINSLTP